MYFSCPSASSQALHLSDTLLRCDTRANGRRTAVSSGTAPHTSDSRRGSTGSDCRWADLLSHTAPHHVLREGKCSRPRPHLLLGLHLRSCDVIERGHTRSVPVFAPARPSSSNLSQAAPTPPLRNALPPSLNAAPASPKPARFSQEHPHVSSCVIAFDCSPSPPTRPLHEPHHFAHIGAALAKELLARPLPATCLISAPCSRLPQSLGLSAQSQLCISLVTWPAWQYRVWPVNAACSAAK